MRVRGGGHAARDHGGRLILYGFVRGTDNPNGFTFSQLLLFSSLIS